jgi:hypothetical protein
MKRDGHAQALAQKLEVAGGFDNRNSRANWHQATNESPKTGQVSRFSTDFYNPKNHFLNPSNDFLG